MMKNGVEITGKYDLPEGFRPLSENLTGEEINRYIFATVTHPSMNDDNSNDPVINTY